jgi:hypothetical protein
MSRLYLYCGLCGRQQADGLLSRGYWGHLDLGGGQALCACPTCKEQHSDWETRLRANAKPNALGVPGVPHADGTSGLI